MADDMDAHHVQLIIHFWKSFDLTRLQKELDQTASQILDRQNDSDISRRELVELSKQFKRTSPENARKIVSPLLKSLQSEIDKLSRRSRAAEAAFLHIYKRIIDIVDPLPALEHWLNSNSNTIRLEDDLPASHAKRSQLETHIDSSNVSIHLNAANRKELTISCEREEENKETNKDNRERTKRTEDDAEINSATRVKQKLANSLLVECSSVGENVQDLQSALNQSQSSENLEADCWRNEKLFYAKSSSLETIDDITIINKMAETEKEANKESNAGSCEGSDESAVNMKKAEKTEQSDSNAIRKSGGSDGPPNLCSANSASSPPSLSSSLEDRLAAKEKEISRLVVDIQRLQSTIVTLKQTTAAQISQVEEILTEKNKMIKHLEAKLERQQDYEEMKRELNLLRAELGHQLGHRDHKPIELYLIEKTKALQSENAALKVANAELSNSLPRHLMPPFLPPFQSLGNVETFGSMLGEEIVNSYAKAFKREIVAVANDQNSSNNATGSPSPPPTSNDDAKSTASVGTPTSTSAINCADESVANNRSNSPANAEMGSAMSVGRSSSPPASIGSTYEKLQQQLRVNVEKYMNETLNTLNISRCVRELLSVHNIGQRLFAKYVLGLSQGTVSELLSKPKPWDKLTEKGRDSYRKMHAWAADERCIYFLKAMVPRKGKESTTYKQEDPAAEERIAQILSEAQRAMLSPNKNGSRGTTTPLLNGDSIQIKSEKLNDTANDANSDNSDRDERADRRSPGSASALGAISGFYRSGDSLSATRKALRKFENDDIPQDMVTRIYQEELAKLIGQQVEDSFRRPHGLGYERTQDEIRQALAIYHQELSRQTQMALAGATPSVSNSELLARFTAASAAAAAAGLVNGANFLSLPHLIDSTLPLDARLRSEKPSNGQSRDPRDALASSSSSSESDLRHASAFSLVRPKPDAVSSGHSKTFSSTPSSVAHHERHDRQNGSLVNSDMNSVEDLSSAASPLQRMQSITNSLLSQSSIPSVPSTPNRPAKAVLPPITQQQFDQYNNLNTEDIVKKVKEQLSQYSISQRLFGESVLGLSQGSVSDLLARPKPWHMLTQKGREPFIRMKMFLEDDNAIHKLVASQYKIAPEKLMRTGSFVAGGTNAPISPVVPQTANNTSPSINSNSSVAVLKSSVGLKTQEISSAKPLDVCRQSISPGYSDTAGHRSSTSTPEHHMNSSSTAIHSSLATANSITRRLGQTSHSASNLSRSSSSSYPYMQPSVYEMAALTTDLDTQSITTKIKETLMAHNIGQKIFGEVVLGLSQGSVSELLSKPKPWHMLSIKGREPFIRMQLWLNDSHNIEKLQTLKNERREANKRRRTHLEDTLGGIKPLDNHLYNFSNSFNTSPNSLSGLASTHGHGSAKVLLSRSSYGAPVAKKARILFSEEQKEALRVAFSMDPYPSTTTIEFLAGELNLSVRTITNWFHNHRMRLKQITSNSDESGANQSQLPYAIGRDGVNFDPNQFRLLLAQRLSDIRVHGASHRHSSSPSHRSKYSNMYSTSPVSSHVYTNTNSCSSPGSSLAEDEMGTLDLSMTSQQHKGYGRRSPCLNEDSDGSVGSDGCEGDESVELDLSKNARAIGSSRRKPQLVTSSSSRRKPAQPQWVDPGLEFSGDEDDDYADDDDDDAMSDDMMDDDEDAYDLVTHRDEIINGVCVRQTDYDVIRNRRRHSLEYDRTVRIEPTPAFENSSRLAKAEPKLTNSSDRENNIKKLEKSIEEEEESWDDELDADDIDRPKSGICDDNVLEECVQ